MSDQQHGDRERTRQLAAWFLGPKAENADWEEKMVLYILQDYFHWRRNYFPSDEILIPQNLRRESTVWNDSLFQQITEMLAGFRRHFPFYSPRYIAHMIADQTLPSILGYFAGLLYNPNNVTPEAAPVTAQWELEVGAGILRMLGYRPPPHDVGPSGTKEEFGWAHTTSGGTVANLEALWLARNIRYFPLAVRDIVKRERIPLTLRLPGETEERHAIDSLDESACLGIKPNQAIYLCSRFIDAVRHHYGLNRSEGYGKAGALLAESEYSIPHHGTRACYRAHPPALFVAGTRHYSLGKIADLLGIGRENLILVDVDAMFRADCRDLEKKFTPRSTAGCSLSVSSPWRARPKKERSTPSTASWNFADASSARGGKVSGSISMPRGEAISAPSSRARMPPRQVSMNLFSANSPSPAAAMRRPSICVGAASR